MDSSRARYLARVGVTALEVSVVLLVIVLLLALGRQMLRIGYLVMGHDTEYYLAVGREVVSGLVPYRDFSFEYPPLAIPAIALPVVVAGLFGAVTSLDVPTYTALLAVENLLLVAVTAVALVWLARRGWSAHSARITAVAYLGLVIATPIVFWRFDALPALLTVLAMCAVVTGRWAWAGLALATGTLVKLYPIALLPTFALRPLLERSWRDLLRLTASALVPVVVGLGLLFVTVGSSAATFLGYQSTRGVQLESVPASVALLANMVWGTPATAFEGFGSWQLESSLLDQIGWLWPVIAVVLLALLAIAALASYRDDVQTMGEVRPQTQVAMIAATVVVTLLAYRVLSPQYLVWLLPFAALLPRHKLLLTLAICALTLYIFPFGYEGLVHLASDAVIALALRNALLLVLFAALVAPGLRIAARGVMARRTAMALSG